MPETQPASGRLAEKAELDTRPLMRSTDKWGLFANLQEHDRDENTWRGYRFEGQNQHLFSSSNDSDKYVEFVLDDCELFGDGRLYWGQRLYNVRDSLIDGCYFHDIGAYAEFNEEGNRLSPYGKREGHGTYCNVNGDLVVQRSRFERCIGQAVQLVHRPHETRIDEKPKGTIQLRDLQVADCSTDPSDRAATALSVFNTGGVAEDGEQYGHDLIVRRVNVWTTEATPRWQNPRDGMTVQSRGQLLAEGQPHNYCSIKHFNGLQIDPERSGVQIKGYGELVWEHANLQCEGVLGRPYFVDIYNVARGKLRGIQGNYVVRINGQPVNMPDGSYQWGEWE